MKQGQIMQNNNTITLICWLQRLKTEDTCKCSICGNITITGANEVYIFYQFEGSKPPSFEQMNMQPVCDDCADEMGCE